MLWINLKYFLSPNGHRELCVHKSFHWRVLWNSNKNVCIIIICSFINRLLCDVCRSMVFHKHILDYNTKLYSKRIFYLGRASTIIEQGAVQGDWGGGETTTPGIAWGTTCHQLREQTIRSFKDSRWLWASTWTRQNYHTVSLLWHSVYIHWYHFVFICSKLKERISQLDQENTSLTKAHVER